VTRLIGIGVALCCGCTIGGVNALPPVDAGPAIDAGADGDGAGPDAAACEVGVDTDGDNLADCDELADGNPVTDPAVFNGLTAIIGDRPEVTGSCDNLDDFAEMETRFATPMQAMDVYAGWEFDTAADDYDDPSYGFAPNWTSADSGRFSVRYNGSMFVDTGGMYCVSIDVGATGTGIVTGKNMCAQVYVGGGPAWLVETGYQADSDTAHTACATLTAGANPIDIVFWYFNVLEQAQLTVRWCFGDADPCTPDTALDPAALQAAAGS
jgi:hypothetical protein